MAGRTNKKRVSLKDVAARAGVSSATVSYVLNGRQKELSISDRAVAAIDQAVKELGYRPNRIAQSLQGGRTLTIGLIVADISNPFFSSIARIIENEAQKHGYIVVFGSNDENAVKCADLIQVLAERQVDGFIIAPSAGTESQIQELLARQVPVVLIDRYFPGIPADFVTTDNYQAGFSGVEYLIRQGRRQITLVTYDTYLEHIRQRIAGAADALTKYNIPLRPNQLKVASFHQVAEQVNAAVEEFSQEKSGVDAIFFMTNSLALEGLKALKRLNIRIPEQIAVLTFDQNDAFELFYSAVTHIRQPLQEMGRQAVELLLARIKEEDREPNRVLLESQLVPRQSCGE